MHIAIAGNIGSGKTTLTRLLAKNYGWKPKYEDVDYNPYLSDFYNDMQRWSFNLQIYFLNRRFKDIVDIAKRNGLVPLVKGKNLTWHQMFDATACPGPYLLSKMDYIVESANALLTSTKYIITPVSVSYRVFTNRWLPDVYGEDVNDANNGYAGVIGVPGYGVQADASVGNLWYRAHVKNADWLPEVKNREDYAGAKYLLWTAL